MALLPVNLTALKRAIADLTARVQAVRSGGDGIEGLLREREDIANAPAHRSDMKALYAQVIEHRQEEYAKLLQGSVEYVSRNWRSYWGPDRAAHAAQYMGVTHANVQGKSPSMDLLLIGILGDKFKPAFDAALDRLSWEGEGLPMAERAAKLAEIDKRLDNLKREEMELSQAAADAGITLTK